MIYVVSLLGLLLIVNLVLLNRLYKKHKRLELSFSISLDLLNGVMDKVLDMQDVSSDRRLH